MSILAEHYGFTEEEPDLVINYDIKYRMGDELRKTARRQVPLFFAAWGGVENLTDRREMFPVGKKTI